MTPLLVIVGIWILLTVIGVPLRLRQIRREREES